MSNKKTVILGDVHLDLNQIQESDQTGLDLIQRLSEFGLSFDEASIFYLLTRVRKSGVDWITGKDLAKIAKRDRVRVYQILQKLELTGLVRANFGRPTGYSAVPPEVAIERLVAIHEARLSQLNSYQSQLKEALGQAQPIAGVLRTGGDDEQNKPAISMFHGVSGIQHLIRETVAGNSLKIIANSQSVEYILSTIGRAHEKPKSCQVILSGSHNGAQNQILRDQKIGLSFESSYLQGHLPSFIITDSQVLILFYSVEKYKPKPLSSTRSRLVMLHALVVSDKIYVEEMHELFDTLWRISMQSKHKPVDREKGELGADEMTSV